MTPLSHLEEISNEMRVNKLFKEQEDTHGRRYYLYINKKKVAYIVFKWFWGGWKFTWLEESGKEGFVILESVDQLRKLCIS